MSVRNRNELWGRLIADELARHGVRDVVLSPGSRSTPLVLAVAADSRLRVHVQIDERSAGFFGLGVGKATGRPAAVVTTSGTAVANLLPAVVEAAQSEAPLLLLTADRPAALRGADANQTIRQPGIFGDYVRRFEDLPTGEVTEGSLRHVRSVVARSIAAALGDPAGPVHLNAPFAKPLEPTPVEGDPPPELAAETTPGSAGREGDRAWTVVEPLRAASRPEVVAEVAEALSVAERPLLVAGVLPRPGEAGSVIVEAARALGVPVLADPLSGARYAQGPDGEEAVVVGGYDIALRSVGTALRPDLVVRVGAAPTSAVLGEWLSGLEGAQQVLVDGGGRWKDHGAVATRLVRSDPVGFLGALAKAGAGPAAAGSVGERSAGVRTATRESWTARWRSVEAAVRSGIRERASSAEFEGAMMAEVVRRVEPGDVLFVSNSMPIRDLDTFVPSTARGLQVFGNRGASGIDGIVSTAAGLSLGSGRRVVAVIGDLALLHDSNGLAFLRESEVRVLLVVINNDGGGIFHLLPIRDYDPPFTSLFVTPHGRRLGTLADLHDLPHVLVEPEPDEPQPGSGGRATALASAWATASGWEGSGILEIRTDRHDNQARRADAIREIASLAAAALD